jgi:sirohydrochlorin ferrochelatase
VSTPVLLLVAHGTRDPRGVTEARRLAAALGDRGVPVRLAFADVLGPTVSEALREIDGPAVLVPAFFAAGFHVRTDVPAEVAASGHLQVSVTPALGPDLALASVQHVRLQEAGWQPGDAVVLAAVGSSEARALADVRVAAELLSGVLDAPVDVAYAVSAEPRVGEVVARLRADGASRVVISPYMLAPGLFHTRLSEAGADVVAAALGVHPLLVDLGLQRYRVGLTTAGLRT